MRAPTTRSALFALALAACVEKPAPPPRAAPPNRPLFRVLEGEKVDKRAPDAAKGPSAPAMDREFVRRLALTKNFQYGAPVRATPTPDGKSVLFLRSGPRDKRQSLFELDVAKGKTRELLSPDAVAKGPETLSAEEHARRERMRITTAGFTSFEISKDGARVLVTLSGRLYPPHPRDRRGEGAPDRRRRRDGSAPVARRKARRVRARRRRVRDRRRRRERRSRSRAAARRRARTASPSSSRKRSSRGTAASGSRRTAKIVYEEADTSKVDDARRARSRAPRSSAGAPALSAAGPAERRRALRRRPAWPAARPTWLGWDTAKFPVRRDGDVGKGGPLALYVLDRAQQNGVLLAADPQTGKTEAARDRARRRVAERRRERAALSARRSASSGRPSDGDVGARAARRPAAKRSRPFREEATASSSTSIRRRGRVTALTGAGPAAAQGSRASIARRAPRQEARRSSRPDGTSARASARGTICTSRTASLGEAADAPVRAHAMGSIAGADPESSPKMPWLSSRARRSRPSAPRRRRATSRSCARSPSTQAQAATR